MIQAAIQVYRKIGYDIAMRSLGPYQIEAELGRGAMGVVFRGFDPAIGRPVAIKVIHKSEFATDEEGRELEARFAREARAAGTLSHPHIVTIYQLGEDNGIHYLVLELVDGRSLAQMLSTRLPFPSDAALPILTQIADALDYAHSRGIVHRDVKPANILIGPDGRAKITDFGIARISSQTVTRTGATMGTPAYMAPEQLLSSKVDGRADQFSLAVIAYQMLSGHLPFVAETDPALMLKIVRDEAAPLSSYSSSLAGSISDTVCRAMRKDPDARFPTCGEFIRELAAAFQRSQAVPVVSRGTETRTLPPPSSRKPVRAGWLVGSLAVTAVLGAWLYFGALRKPAEAPKPPSPAAEARPAPAVPVARPAALPKAGRGKDPAAARRMPVAGEIQETRLLHRVDPSYPPLAKEARIAGLVQMSAVIGRDGAIQSLKVIRGHPLLVPAALEAVKQWTYQPTLLNGRPVEVQTQIDVNFVLRPGTGK